MSTIEIKFDDKEVRQLLNHAMQSLGGDMTGLMRNIGEYVTQDTQERFDRQRDPDGNMWKPLKPSTLARKKTNKILVEQGRTHGLQASINYRASKTSVSIGTNKVYAAIHQFGGKTSAHIIKPKRGKALRWVGAGGRVFFAKQINHPGSVIPARPFLGINKENVQEITEIIKDWMKFKGI